MSACFHVNVSSLKSSNSTSSESFNLTTLLSIPYVFIIYLTICCKVQIHGVFPMHGVILKLIHFFSFHPLSLRAFPLILCNNQISKLRISVQEIATNTFKIEKSLSLKIKSIFDELAYRSPING